MKHTTQLLFIILIGISISSCRCKDDRKPCTNPSNPDCENYDPCYGKKTINTFFKVRPGDRGFPPPPDWCDLEPTDTFNASSVIFEIPDGNPANSTYEWQIGAETRTDKKFEIDFSDYLKQGHWETHIPITLTIRTPLNDCLQNKADTLKVVTRELFFTERWYSGIYPPTILPRDTITERHYKGYLISNPSRIFNFKITKVFQNYYNGYYIAGLAYFYVGLPFADSIMIPRDVSAKGCGNFKHGILLTNRFNDPRFSELTHYLRRIDYFIIDEKKRKITMSFFNNHHSDYTFIGEEI